MKKFKLMVLCLAALLGLSGCHLELPSPDTLIASPASNEEKIQQKQIISKLLSDEDALTLTVPDNMDDPSAYIVVDIDKDGEKAVAAVDDMAAGMIAEVESEMAKVNASLADGIGDIETGFTARATIQEVAASIPSSLNAGRMGAGATAGGETTVTNHFHIAALQVREEADVKKVAKELYNMQKTKTRSKGVVT